ncbi:MAG: DNA-processing protein DprA [Lachnospiraceae bacterium]|nr:DNA-processing protein DprA [Lachnospiraceae bacterium]
MKYKFWYAQTHTLSNTQKRMLFECYGDYEKIYNLEREKLLALPFLKEENLEAFLAERTSYDLEENYFYAKHHSINVTCYFDDDYPEKLKHIHNIPYQIFYIGRLPAKDERIIAMVGARRCSGYGKSYTLEIAKLLAQRGCSIVSGMATGIDSFSHEGALEAKGDTFAVLGCGVDICYPPKNHLLYKNIIEHGGVLSEYGPKVSPRPEFFPRRNRIISGLSDVVLLMEAKEKSGSLITAEFALEQGKDIFALPGRISDSLSQGTNKIISLGAGVILSSEQLLKDIYELKDWNYDPVVFSTNGKFNLEKEELLVYSCFDFNSKSIDEVVAMTGLDIMSVLQIILRLCDLGLIEESFMNQYIKV